MTAPNNNGLDLNYVDKGVGIQTNNAGDYGMFAAASLRNIALTAPYMHDGRFSTLAEVIEHYNSGVKNHPNLGAALRQNNLPNPSVPPKQLNLVQSQKDAMVAFLRTLTDTMPAHQLKWLDPFDPANAPSGISGVINRLPMEVYPNPIQSTARVRFTNPEHELFNIRILDQNGRMISQDQTRADNYLVDMNDLPSGVYMVEVFNDSKRQVEKVVLK
jgi:cytochrome c peroxidase